MNNNDQHNFSAERINEFPRSAEDRNKIRQEHRTQSYLMAQKLKKQATLFFKQFTSNRYTDRCLFILQDRYDSHNYLRLTHEVSIPMLQSIKGNSKKSSFWSYYKFDIHKTILKANCVFGKGDFVVLLQSSPILLGKTKESTIAIRRSDLTDLCDEVNDMYTEDRHMKNVKTYIDVPTSEIKTIDNLINIWI